MTDHVTYLAVGGENKLILYDLDDAGTLTPRREIALAGAPGPLAIDPTQRYLYVGLRSTKEVVSYQINAENGELTQVGTAVPLQADPCYLAVDKSGKWLLAASYSGGQAFVHPLQEDGTVAVAVACTRETETYAHCIELDPSNRYTFLPHVETANVIYQYRFDAATGQLTPNSPARIEPAPGVGPRHYVYHPTQPILYFSNEQEGSVTAYHLDPEQGTLTSFQSLSTLPTDFRGENTCAQLHITPDGRFLYVSNRGHDSIAIFAIAEETGLLTARGQQPTEPIPRAFNVDPTGRFLFVTGQGSGKMTAYRINQSDGSLQALAQYSVGKQPMWVTILALAA